jgi:formamidopyrimidine-DNA glycosylase
VPELPEVETIVRDLAPRLVGRTFGNPRLHKPDVLREISRRRLLAVLRDRTIEAVERRAKHVVILLAGGRRLVIQPRMTGTLLVYDRPLTAAERKYAVFEARVGDEQVFVYRDVRRLGTMWLLDEAAWTAYTARIGPEPLSPDFDTDRFAEQLRGSRQAIKKVLMDQRRIAGIGNIYANEALFRAQIDPSRQADRLTRKQLVRLYDEVRTVLAAAIEAQGTTLRDYRTGTGEPGRYQHLIEVYGRGGQPCVRCGTTLVTTHALDGRATTLCWRCQGPTP